MEMKLNLSEITSKIFSSENEKFDPDKRVDFNLVIEKKEFAGFDPDKRVIVTDENNSSIINPIFAGKKPTIPEPVFKDAPDKFPSSMEPTIYHFDDVAGFTTELTSDEIIDENNKAIDSSKVDEKLSDIDTLIDDNLTDDNNEEPNNQNDNGSSKQSEVQSNDIKDNVDNNKTRELTDKEKQWLKDTLGWSDKQIAKCTIDENGVIHYKTDRCDLEGKTAENGVPYVKKQIEINGVKIEGVFPKFDAVFTTYLSPENQKSNAYAKECNAKLKEALQDNPELRSKFTDEQLKDIENGRTPTGYVWHHNEEQGKMELVKRSDHDKTIGGAAHTGGSALWGPDSIDKSQKGENF